VKSHFAQWKINQPSSPKGQRARQGAKEKVEVKFEMRALKSLLNLDLNLV
jgi:hypothetical protein